MNRSGWIAAQWLKYLGVPGLAGLVLVALAVAALVGFVLPAEVKLQRVTGESEELQNRLRMELDHPADHALPAGANLTSFYQTFPPEQNSVKLLEQIYHSADKESLHLAQGEYRFIREKTGPLGRYQIILPVKGSYVQIRKFIAKAMNTIPSMALDGVSFRRETIGGADLEAKIQFSIYLGAV